MFRVCLVLIFGMLFILARILAKFLLLEVGYKSTTMVCLASVASTVSIGVLPRMVIAPIISTLDLAKRSWTIIV